MIDRIQDILDRRGAEDYAGEPVSQLQHALQCALLAQSEGAGDELVAAALLHDIGHLLDPEDADQLAARGVDGNHEEIAAAWLSSAFGSEVTEPIRLHVPAKRYICATDPAYLSRLSPASIRSLELQGGPFGESECRAFEEGPHFQAAIRLRQWDDMAKDPDAVTPPLDHFLLACERALTSTARRT